MDKITHASQGALGEDFHRSFEAAVIHERKKLGDAHPMFINGKPVKAGKAFTTVNPAHQSVVMGKFQSGGREHVRKAVAAAKNAAPFWQELGWPARVNFLRKAAELMTKHQYELAALLALEVGKTRAEAIAEVNESVDIIQYYSREMEAHRGFDNVMNTGGNERTRTVLKPYGVFAVVSPFSFPLALATGMSAAALVAGNTVVFKPSSAAPFTGLRLYEMLHRAGMPVGVFNYVTGAGKEVGDELIENQEIDGMAFTGSRDAGMEVLRRFNQERSRPRIIEMGGKNPCIVMPTANLDDAVEGTARAAFAMGGQNCSACSRVYVHQSVSKKFIEALVEKAKSFKVGDPVNRETHLGPLINKEAVEQFEAAVKLGKKDGDIAYGGRALDAGDLKEGYYVEPTIIRGMEKDSRWLQEEFLTPIVAVIDVRSLEEAIALANKSDFGLSAGIFTQIEDEQREFFTCIEAGTAYCNRRSGATSGAWPGVQSFGGWKQSGSTGKNSLGPYYLPQFMREQSQTLVSRAAAPVRPVVPPQRADLVPVV